MKNRRVLLVTALLFAGSTARADAGTALMWTGFLHFVIGNWLIALFEATIISAVFRVSYGRAAIWLIVANYVSYFAGIALAVVTTTSLEVASGSFVLRHGMLVLVGLIVTSYLLSIVVEWPFCFELAMPGPRRPLKALMISVLAQTASYSIIVPFYLMSSPVTLLTQAQVQRDAGFGTPAVATIYYIGNDGSVWQVSSDAKDRRTTGITDIGPHEGLWLAPDKAGRGDLWAVYHADGEPLSDKARVLRRGLTAPRLFYPSDPRKKVLNYQEWVTIDLRGKASRDWGIRQDPMAGRGITVGNHETQYSLVLDTPFISWYPERATLIPGDRVVFELGPNIVLLDMPTKRMAVLAEGRCPVVVLKKPIQ